ncbi:hypothetical protein LAZ67_X003774 [Cordylochernes scorpioides]|uniref:Peptidase aspartic putative domain-containing protein n=1 Tax=Cordylochernes scorpioides TaxID=51811 RepID=A0ABY6LUD6_9ARAC|nr:hypothetical protein LAZ67_X003774 [Cordylochernes scorpioides]
MNRLKKGRRPVRGQITKLINSVETALKKPVEELDKTDLRVSALQLEDLCRDLHEWDEKITEAMLDEEIIEAEQDKEYDERLRYDRLIKRMREELEKVLNLKKGVSPQPDETSSDTSNSTSRRRILLPKRKLPEFEGDVREWITFWKRFEDIHNDEDLSDSDKCQYLVECMLENSEAQQLVLSYPVSGKNYASIMLNLKERVYNDHRNQRQLWVRVICISCPASATNQIARCIRKPTFGSWAHELASKKIQLSEFKAESDVVELLLGADINPKIATANIRLSDDLIAQETLLGWVVQGKTKEKSSDKNPNQVHNSMLITSLMTQEIKFSNLWSLENIGVIDDGQAESKKETDQAVMDKFRTETKRLESGRYEKRLRKMTEDLKKRDFYHHYNKIFEEWEEKGITKRIQSDQEYKLEYFLPHRAVVKSGSSTTPVQPVFDASCKTKVGWSRNDCFAKGPNLLELIPDIMLRFRLNKISIVADIEKAFLQI